MTAFLPAFLGPLASGDPVHHILPEEKWNWSVFGHHLSVSNHLVMLCVAGLLMLIVFPLVARSKERVPRGFRNMVETVLQFLREQVARPSLHEATDKFMPFLWTVFFLVLFSNLLGLLPIDALLSAITGREWKVAGTATGNISITAGLAVCAFLMIHIGGIREQGFVHYAKHFAPPVPWPLLILLVPLEILGSFVKPFALAIRLFANMIAGHIVLAVIIGFVGVLANGVGGMNLLVGAAALFGAVFMSLLEVLVAFLQAYIFTYLTTLFIGMAVHPEH